MVVLRPRLAGTGNQPLTVNDTNYFPAMPGRAPGPKEKLVRHKLKVHGHVLSHSQPAIHSMPSPCSKTTLRLCQGRQFAGQKVPMQISLLALIGYAAF